MSQNTFPRHYPGSVLLRVIETVLTVKEAWINSQEKNFIKLQCLVAFSEVNVCSASKSLIRGSISWGFFWWLLLLIIFCEGKDLESFFEKSFLFFCLFLCLFLFYLPGNGKVFLCEVSYPCFSLKLCYSSLGVVDSHFSNGFSSLEILFILSPV